MFHRFNKRFAPIPIRNGWNVLFYLVLLIGLTGFAPAAAVQAHDIPRVYQNPLSIQIPGGGMVESCADPSIIYSHTPGDKGWYIYCTTDPLNKNDKTGDAFNFHLISIQRSEDMVHWTYAGDVFQTRPSWAADDAGLWAPDIHYMNNQYYLYYTASWTKQGGSAIGVATSPTPTGPWTDRGIAVQPTGFWVFDPALITDDSGQTWLYYGSYYGGVYVRKLSADGLTTDPASQVQVTIPNRYEGTFVVRHGGYYYLFGSATNCCAGPLTGYSVFVGRSKDPTGPFVDKEGVSLLAGRVGGTPVISMNGNRWVGPGHNAVFTDFAGHDWFLYHAIDRNDPYLNVATNLNRRPALMDPLTWVNGWPTVRGGLWASDTPQPAPAAQPGDETLAPLTLPVPLNQAIPGKLLTNLSDGFNGAGLSPQWSWVRPPAPDTYGVADGVLSFQTQDADIYVDSNNASVLTEPTPAGPYIVETRVALDVPPEGCCHNYVQAGLVVYGDDNNFVKLAVVSIWETRQTEWAKEWFPVPDGYPRYGNSVVTAPGDWTYLRIAKTVVGPEENYTAYTSRDGFHWNRGGTWTHQLGRGAKIGLVSMGGSGFTAKFDYVRVFQALQLTVP